MKLLVAVLPSLAMATTNCSEVHEFLYGYECGLAMNCASDFACYIPNESCNEYHCMYKESCPDGYEYRPFIESPSGGDTHNSASSQGFYCHPISSDVESPKLDCFFDAANNHKLTVHVTVPGIAKQPQHTDDDRVITWVSQETYDTQQDANAPFVTVFGNNPQCQGRKDGDNVEFSGIALNDNSNCGFTTGSYVDDAGVLWYTQSFVVGYDDYTHNYPGLGPVAKRYGRHYNMQCTIKASDTLWVEPGAEGNREEDDIIEDTEIRFEMKVFYDSDFTLEFSDAVDIGVESLQDQRVYVQASGSYPNDSPYALHLKSCEIENYKMNADGSEERINNPLLMMSDGCLAGYDEDFIRNNFNQQSTRSEWNDASTKTVNRDQFEVDLWEVPVISGDKIEYRFTCNIVACSIAGFQAGTDGTGVCSLNSQCSNRYDNLYSTFFRAAPKTQRTEILTEKMTFSVNVVEGKTDIGVPEQKDPSDPSDSGALSTAFSCMFLLFALLF